jgi:hypothetical protein
MSNAAAVIPAGGIPGREVILEGMSGPAAGLRLEILDGTIASVGRSDKAKFMIARDARMAEVHFEITAAGAKVSLKDLNSGYGTHINTRRVRDAELRHGDIISAGHSTFRVRIHTPETWPDITPAEYALVTLLYGSGERVYAILDAAVDDRIPAVLQAYDTEHACLYDGNRAVQLKSVAPYIAHIPRGSKILRTVVREGWGKNWGVYLTAPVPLASLRAHLLRFISFQNAVGQKFFYRFYDPRVLRNALPAARAENSVQMFGPINRFVMEDESPAVALDFWNPRVLLQADPYGLAGTSSFRRVPLG